MCNAAADVLTTCLVANLMLVVCALFPCCWAPCITAAPQGFRDSGIGSQGIRNSLAMMVKTKSTVINLDKESYTMG